MSSKNIMTCPLCGFKTDVEYTILLHMEESHSEGQSPFVADSGPSVSGTEESRPVGREAGSDEDVGLFMECPIDGCLEQISLAELADHIDLHALEENDELASDAGTADATPVLGNTDGREYRSPYSSPEDIAQSTHGYERERARPPVNHDSTVDAWKKIFNRRHLKKPADWENRPGDGKGLRKRLGVSELGKHAYEHQMPDSLVALLRKRKYTSAEGIIPVLARLLEQSPSTEYAYLCHPAVQHISKLRGEGGFCGYRNIQMLSSYIVGARVKGAEVLGERIPSIFRIQDYIESAWDMGINASGRIETGGVKGTRKYIGTPEAQAMFISLQIPCEAEGFKSPKEGVAEAALFASVQKYFENAAFDSRDKVRCTELPPIYFQHRGHSLTIVGLERRASGSLKLLVFDPMFHDPEGVVRLAGKTAAAHHDNSARDTDRNHKIRNRIIHRNPDGALRLYRRGNNYLRKYREFELLR
ncbi:peptidase family C78-domain-containing protein [Xylaria bambusicola]|uniref:peptidase family C78-domain-containing protein n=1 Tax=Xylaria bambusicola TaxID=326684 RepID=UPI0020082317|nr:peptidase family C78-domain-containing protein [Xylaria bambusicola]KAI0503287.1 peptidase family C78-domain-containing protein [Xylaria bambusicola]